MNLLLSNLNATISATNMKEELLGKYSNNLKSDLCKDSKMHDKFDPFPRSGEESTILTICEFEIGNALL